MSDESRTSEIEALRLALIAYRDAAQAWLDAAGRLGSSERQIAARLLIGRMAINRLRRFVEAREPIAMFDRVPGVRTRGEIARVELPDRPAAEGVRRRLREATEKLDIAVQRVPGDREQVRRLLASMDEAGRRTLLRDDRKTLFEADARMRGVDAENLVGSVLIAPASDGRSCDVAPLQLVGGLQVHRPETDVTIYRPMNGYADLRHDGFPVDLDPERDGPLLSLPGADSVLSRILHSSHEFLEYRTADDADRQGRVDLGFGEIHPRMGPMDATGPDDTADMALPILFPVRHAAMELWIHRGVRRDPKQPWPSLLRNYRFVPQLGMDAESPVVERLGEFAPVENPIEEAGGLVSFSTLRRELLDRAADRLGVSLADFEVHRFSEPYPPVDSGLRIFWRLASPD